MSSLIDQDTLNRTSTIESGGPSRTIKALALLSSEEVVVVHQSKCTKCNLSSSIPRHLLLPTVRGLSLHILQPHLHLSTRWELTSQENLHKAAAAITTTSLQRASQVVAIPTAAEEGNLSLTPDGESENHSQHT